MTKRAQTATPEKGGVFTCGECATFYSHAKAWELKYHRMARLFLRAGWKQLLEINPKTGRTFAEDFELIDGRSTTQYVAEARANDGR